MGSLNFCSRSGGFVGIPVRKRAKRHVQTPTRTRCQVLNCRVRARRDHTRRRSHHDGEPGSATESLQRCTGDPSLPSPARWVTRVRASSRCSSGPNLKHFVAAFAKSQRVCEYPPMPQQSYRWLGTARCCAAVQAIACGVRSGGSLFGEALGKEVVTEPLIGGMGLCAADYPQLSQLSPVRLGSS